MATVASARLDIPVDVGALQRDVDGLSPSDWVPHFNTSCYDGDWSGVALRSVGGEDGRLYPDPSARGSFADCPTLARCVGARAVLEGLRCELLAARFLRLGPGAHIKEHRDLDLGLEDGEVRLHIPVRSGPGVAFQLDGSPVTLAEGEVWYLDLNLLHAAVNLGPRPRVHLVVDCVVDDWLRATFPPS